MSGFWQRLFRLDRGLDYGRMHDLLLDANTDKPRGLARNGCTKWRYLIIAACSRRKRAAECA